MTALEAYRKLERRLYAIRQHHRDAESAEEDRILDEMDLAWDNLSAVEQAIVRDEGPHCWDRTA